MSLTNTRVIFQDVDGCLNPSTGEDFGVDASWQPSSAQIEMIQRISQTVAASPLDHFVINTGRFWPILSSLVSHIETSKFRYCVLEHGCVVYDRITGTNLDLPVLSKELGLVNLADRFRLLGPMQELLSWYRSVGQSTMEAKYEVAMPCLDKAANLSFAFPEQVDGAEVLAFVAQLIRSQFPLEVTRHFEFCRSDRFIDILPGIHKLDGIHFMCTYLGVSQERSLAIGDYLNDLSVFESFDRVLCPSNAHPSIIEHTRSKGECGVVSKFPYGDALLEFLKTL